MSSQERIHNNILSIEEQIRCIDKDIEMIETDLKKDGLSDEEKKILEEDLQLLVFDRSDLQADIAMLDELLTKMKFGEDQNDDYPSGGGLDWNESGYFD
jgi:hypothetical protein